MLIDELCNNISINLFGRKQKIMMKKTVFFVLCLVPFGAWAIDYPYDGSTSGDTDGYNAGAAGLNVPGFMQIGGDKPVSGSDWFYANPTVADDGVFKDYTVNSSGNISVDGALTVNDGYKLYIQNKDDRPIDSVLFGSINAAGALNISDVNALSVKGNFDISVGNEIADNVDTGAENEISVKANTITVEGNLISGGGGTVSLTANGASDAMTVKGTLQNGMTGDGSGAGTVGGEMDINLGGNLNVGGDISNAGNMNITQLAGKTANITVGGAITNLNPDGEMIITANELTVKGGADASFVNAGDLIVNITGSTVLNEGFDLSAMGTGNLFKFTTGTLGITSGDWTQLVSNKLNEFYLTVKNGDLNFGTSTAVSNGASGSENNTAANMYINASGSVSGASVNNSGNRLSIVAGKDITINGAVVENGLGTGVAPDKDVNNTNYDVDEAPNYVNENGVALIANGTLTVNGAVTNKGNMQLTGNTVNLADVTNQGNNLTIKAPTDASGTIKTGTITNKSGNLVVNSHSVDIANLTVNGGNVDIHGANTTGNDLTIGSVVINGGVVDVDAIDGGIVIGDDASGTGAVTKQVFSVGASGALNFGSQVNNLTIYGGVQIDGDLTSDAVATNGDVSFDSNMFTMVVKNDGPVVIGGSINTGNSFTLDAENITVVGDIGGGAGNILKIGSGASETYNTSDFVATGSLNVGGQIFAGPDVTIEIFADDINVKELADIASGEGKFIVHGSQIDASEQFNLFGGLWFDDSENKNGMIVKDTNNLTINVNNGVDGVLGVYGGISIANGNSLTLNLENNLNAKNNYMTLDASIVNAGNFTINQKNSDVAIEFFDATVENSGTMELNGADIISYDGDVTIDNTGTFTATLIDSADLGAITNSGTMTVETTGENGLIETGAITANGGTLVLDSSTVDIAMLDVNNGAVVSVDADKEITVQNGVTVDGNMFQGTGNGGALNLVSNDTVFNGQSLYVTGGFNAAANTGKYVFENQAVINGTMTVARGATVDFAANGINLANLQNAGDLTLDSGAGYLNLGAAFDGATINTGALTLDGKGLTTKGNFVMNTTLYQGYNGNLTTGINIAANDYVIKSTGVNITGGVNVSDSASVRFAKLDADVGGDWIDVNINGNVSGGVGFWGVRDVNINGNYTFNNNSDLWAAILGRDERDYWTTISLTDGNRVGQIEDGATEALITVENGQFISNVSGVVNGSAGENVPNVTLTMFDIADANSAIWLLHADGGLNVADGFDKLRNLDVQFCNADGTVCYDYMDTMNKPTDGDAYTPDNKTGLPVYLTERDTDGDGVADSLFVVFDPTFGGPVAVYKIKPIVAETVPHTDGEIVSAGALDNLIAGQLANTKFYKDTPIELIPEIFQGTAFAEMSRELYNRMEYYNMTGQRDSLARFSRLFQAREIEQVAGSIALNEHTNFRSFEDRMFDEFIWNRNRNISKAWFDVDFGMFVQDVADGKRVDGNRFNVSAGFDWQNSETLILGLTTRVSHMDSDSFDNVDLSYLPDTPVNGRVDINVADTNVGLGGYLMKILGEKTRAYGNAFLDLHMFDLTRDQTFVDSIGGDGTAFSLISEWGLMHDWLNQYIVGNAYARVGYNFGFDITEQVNGEDYMNLESDGYFILTPGYSLIAQKRIYPSAWFQVRPYASIGIEYDVFGAPDFAKYKFAPAHDYTKYDIDIDPMWANIGGGIEFLAANGLQVGVDYRYQYNDAIQLHNIKVSGSYRF